MSVIAYVGLGANLGDATHSLQQAVRQIDTLPGTVVLQTSSLYRSAPVQANGPDYTNAVTKIDTSLPAHTLLRGLQDIECRHGRTRPYTNAPRTLDLDILLYGNEVLNDAELTVPHPRMHERAFVLLPLHELDRTLILKQGSLSELISRCADQRIWRMPACTPIRP